MNTIAQNNTTQEKRPLWKRFAKPGKHMFWAWIAYQTVKGTLTTSLIWIPLIWMWLHS